MFFDLCFLVFLSTVFVRPVFSQGNPFASGNYRIRHCGTGPDSKAAKLQALLPHFRNLLDPVLGDVRLTTASKAYDVFFKSHSNAVYVQGIFEHIADGAPFPSRETVPGASGPDGSPHPLYPSIICLNPGIAGEGHLSALCEASTGAAVIPGREIMVVCPSFWDLAEGPKPQDCPQVQRNRFRSGGYWIARNQFAAFVHEFAHVYTGTQVMRNETHDANGAVELSAERAVGNAGSYALYAAMVVAGCTQYPGVTFFP